MWKDTKVGLTMNEERRARSIKSVGADIAKPFQAQDIFQLHKTRELGKETPCRVLKTKERKTFWGYAAFPRKHFSA